MKVSMIHAGVPSSQLTFKQLDINKIGIAENSNPILSRGLELALESKDGVPSLLHKIGEQLRIFMTWTPLSKNQIFGCVENLNLTNPQTFRVEAKEGDAPLKIAEDIIAVVKKGAQELGFQD